jgi:hypothetical protein
MKIISKFKDFYDYLQGIYGIDEKLVLDRTNFTFLDYPHPDFEVSTLHIGEMMIQGLWMNGKIYFGEEVKQFSKEFTRSWDNKPNYYLIENSPYKYFNSYCLKYPMFLGEKSPTWKENYPILQENRKKFGSSEYIKCPILKEYSVQKILPPEKVWQILSEWLGRQITKNEKEVPIGDDKVRILSHGFDLKKSFRHRK